MSKNKQGFTLAELLIVVAIIAVLVAISIPIFSSQLEKSREAVDAANIRSSYAEIMAEAISSGEDVNTDGSIKISLKQQQDDWQNTTFKESLESLGTISGEPSSGGYAWVSFEVEGNTVTIHFDNDSGGGSSGSGESGGGSQSNTTTANAIGNKVVELISGASNNTQVLITVSSDGEVSVSVPHGNADADTILAGLKSAGLVSDSGVVDFDSDDTVYVNGYQIKINKNNGNGGSIHISPISN